MAFFDLKSTIFHYFSLNFTKFRLNIPIFGIKFTEIGVFGSKFGNLGFGIFDPPPFPGKSFGIWHFPAGIFRARGGIIWHLAFWPRSVQQGLAHLWPLYFLTMTNIRRINHHLQH